VIFLDNDESLNYVIPPPKCPLVTNTDCGWTHAIAISSDIYRDASTASTNDEGAINSLNSDVFSVNDHILETMFWRMKTKIYKDKQKSNKYIKYQILQDE